VVTDSSSGIGYETSLLLARNGFFTYATIISIIIESITRDPDKYNFLVSSRLYNGGQFASSQHYIDVYRTLILDEAQKLFELMETELSDKIIGKATFAIPPQH
jgi:hypothetical protein